MERLVYVCVCNGFTERDVYRAAAEGADTPAKVHRVLGTAMQCAHCLAPIRELLNDVAAGRNGTQPGT